MFKNIDEIKKFIVEENIVNIDIRSITNQGVKSVVFNAVLSSLEDLLKSKNIILDFNSSFMEVFLAHKTLVVFTETLELLEKVESNSFSFAILNNEVDILATPERDNYRDFVGEVVSALGDMGEEFSYFYADADNMYTIVLNTNTKYSLEKVKYAIQMVAKAYNVDIDKTKGVFKL